MNAKAFNSSLKASCVCECKGLQQQLEDILHQLVTILFCTLSLSFVLAALSWCISDACSISKYRNVARLPQSGFDLNKELSGVLFSTSDSRMTKSGSAASPSRGMTREVSVSLGRR
jgi:hypothetical protein